MKICDRHARMIQPPESYNHVFQKFAERMNVYAHQERIELRKDKCMVCNFGREGTVMLLDIIGMKKA